MALTITINDEHVNLATGQNVVYLSTNSTGAGVYNFRYLMELTYHVEDSGSPVTKEISFTQQQNQAGDAVFNLSEIYKTIVTPQITPSTSGDPSGGSLGIKGVQKSIHNLPTIVNTVSELYTGGLIDDANGLEAFRGVANVLTLKFYEYYATTPGGIPEKQTDGTGDDTKSIYLIWGRGQEDEGVILDWLPYRLFNDTKKFLSGNYFVKDGKYQVYLGKDDYHTFAFLNRFDLYTSSTPKFLYIEYFDSSGVSLGDLACENDSASGGAYDATLDDERFYLFCGIGLSNLQKIDTSESPYTGTLPDSVTGGRSAIKYYDVYFSANASGAGTEYSATYRFNVETYCDKYEVSRLAYMNRFGAWEYINLNKKRDDVLKVKKEYVTKPLLMQQVGLAQFDRDYINTAYPPEVAKQGMMSTSVAPVQSFTLFTDYLQDFEIEQIKDLMMSPQIHLLDGEFAKALILENSDMKLKGEKNRGLYQYELKFNFANPKYRTT